MKKSTNLRQLAEETLLADFTPPAVIVNHEGDILYFHEQTGRYLEPAAGEANLNLLHMAREGLRLLLSNMVRKAAQEQKEFSEQHVQVKIDEHYELIDLIVRPLDYPEYDDLLLVVFQRPTPPLDSIVAEEMDESETEQESKVSNQRVIELERELKNTREHLQSTVEDLETPNEELKSTNEELQSANEELQSTNEELTSAKEELQSVNEELMTVNAELEHKIDELSRANDDLRNLLTSVEIGIVFLDQDLRILRFNPAATNFLDLRERDIDRPIAHIASRLEYDQLIQDAEDVLDTLEMCEREVRMNGHWYMLRLRPYRTSTNIIDGVIITFSDITQQKHVQQDLRKLSRAVDQSTSIIMIMDVNGIIEYANQRFYSITGYSEPSVTGEAFHRLLADGMQETQESILHDIVTSRTVWRGELQHRKVNEDTFWVDATISPLTDERDEVTHLITVEDDITSRKQLEQTLHDRRASQREAGSMSSEFAVLVFDRNLNYLFGQGDALPGIGLSEADMEGNQPLKTLPSELEQYYYAALRGDNVYFERESGRLRFGLQVMPVRNREGGIIAGIMVVWDITGKQAESDNDAAE